MKKEVINIEKLKLLYQKSSSNYNNQKYQNNHMLNNPVELNKNNLNLEQLTNNNNEPHKEESDSIKNIYYVPICKENGCEGHLRISIDEEKFIINGKCQKNKEHIYNNLYFENFEKYYLKEKKIQNCFKCSNNLENKYKFICNECKNIYCSNCFISDIHIKKDIQNLKIMTNRCQNCQNEFLKYCIDCGKKICLICTKKNEKNNSHEKHNVINILDMIPSKNYIKNLKEKIRKKSDAFNLLIKSLTEWQNELNKKIEKIKENLKNELSIIKKLFLNFNSEYMDYTYYSNFNEFFKLIDNYNNSYLNQFMESENFKEKTKSIFDLLININKESEIIKNKRKLKEYYFCYNLEKFTEEYCLCYSKQNKYISLLYEHKTGFCELPDSKINFNEDIFCFNFSPDRKKIYVCLAKRKAIYILNYDSEKNTLKLSDENISIWGHEHCNKCIYINNDCLLIIDNFGVYLFKRDNLNNKKFSNTKKINFEFQIFDICQIDGKYAIISQKSKITFINIENLKIEKEINNIDCIERYNNLALIKDYILVNCKNGIGVLSIKDRELIQFISNDENLGKSKTVKTINNHIYILYSLGYLLKYSFSEYNLVLKEKTELETPYTDFRFDNKKFIIFKDNSYIYNNKIYILEK